MCLVVALMQPQWGETEEDVPRRGRDLVVMLDTSLSMLAEDVAPNRLEYAKRMVRELVGAVRAEGGHRLALVDFRRPGHVAVPADFGLWLVSGTPRRGRSGPREHQGYADRRCVAPDAAIVRRLEPGYTDLLLITDGDDHGSLPTHAARLLADRGIALYVVGVGSPRRRACPLG